MVYLLPFLSYLAPPKAITSIHLYDPNTMAYTTLEAIAVSRGKKIFIVVVTTKPIVSAWRYTREGELKDLDSMHHRQQLSKSFPWQQREEPKNLGRKTEVG